MCSYFKCLLPLFSIAFLSLVSGLHAEEETKPVVGAIAADTLPAFSLKDPAGLIHTNTELAGKKVVILVSVPTNEHGGHQRAWINGILEQNAGAGKDYMLVLVQDMTQSGNKVLALEGMKSTWKPGNPTLILVDDAGEFRSALEAQKGTLTDKTSLLIYDEKGKLIHSESNKATLTNVKAVQGKLAVK